MINLGTKNGPFGWNGLKRSNIDSNQASVPFSFVLKYFSTSEHVQLSRHL